ncbi:Plexin domain-containing protein 2 [Lamellibrachia satsuma]|nr:Plexin domain-containing protein 2 [Lamellibrachia satsuma]
MPGTISFFRLMVVLVLDKQLSTAKEGQAVPRELEEINRNLPKPVKPNVVKETTNHVYYTARVLHGANAADQWAHLDIVGHKLPDKSKHVTTLLSSHYNKAQRIQLPFRFPFYGHDMDEVLVATGGFLFTGPFVHPHLTGSEYIAPLMANFDTELGNKSFVKYFAMRSMAIVSWENLHLRHKPGVGTFSFQVTLYKDGLIVFAYKQIPIPVGKIGTRQHPVKVGMSDAYIIETPEVSTIYRYHQVNIPWSDIVTSAAVVLTPLPTCNRLYNCVDCQTSDIGFDCYWCNTIGRCSSGFDRSRQQWLTAGCPTDNATLDHCSVNDNNSSHAHTSRDNTTANPRNSWQNLNLDEGISTTPSPAVKDASPAPLYSTSSLFNGQRPMIEGWTKHRRTGAGAAIGISLAITVIVALAGIFTFAYNRPQSRSGQWLIRYRPANLRSRISQVSFWRNRERNVVI